MRYLFLTLLFILGLNTFSQKIDGVGKFKIDKTQINTITEIENELKKTCQITNELEFFLNKKEYQFSEILLDSSNIRLFYLNEYIISDIKLTNIYFFFYNDYLIQFRCDRNKELDMILARKYGRPIIEQRTIPKIKNTILNLEYDEFVSKFTWIGGNVVAISFERKQLFDGIAREADSYFKIFDRTYSVLINKININ